MIGDIQLSAQLTFNKSNLARQAPFTLGETGTGINVTGAYRSDGIAAVTTGDAAFPLGSVGTIGWVALKNLGSALIDTPAAPTVTVIGSAGTTHYEYGIVARQADGGYTVIGATTTTTTGNATLTTGNYNHVTWAAVDNAVSYDVYLVSTTGSATTGLLANVTSPVYDHKVPTQGDGSTAPATTPYNFDVLVSLDAGSTYPIKLRGGETHPFRVNSAVVTSIHRKAVANNVQVAFLICDA